MSDYFDRVERQIVRRVESGVPRTMRMPGALHHLGTAVAVLVVIVVAGVFLLARGDTPASPTGPAATAHGGLTVAFAPQALPGGPDAGAEINRTVRILTARLHQAVPGGHVHVAWTGGHFVIHVPKPGRGTRAQILTLAAPGRLEFYDWEASALTPNGKTVAGQLQAQDRTALTISQGSGSASPGDTGAGCISLDAALALAAKQPQSSTPVLVQAVGPIVGQAPGAQNPTAGYYVLRGEPALSGSEITDPHQTKDPNTGAPDVTFDFTARGARAFQALTATIARRGALLSGAGDTLNQHFAIVLDDRLISVPYVDFKQYPDGISAGNGANLTAGFTKQSAADVAILLRYGPLPIRLTPAG